MNARLNALTALAGTELNRKRRGHRFYPTKNILARIPSVEDASCAADALVYAHFFGGPVDIYVTGLDSDGTAFGFVRFAHMPENAEWGLVDLREYEAFVRGLVIIERDLSWEPVQARLIPHINDHCYVDISVDA